MKIAIPITNNKISTHFGHCEVFSFFDVDTNDKTITEKKDITPPPHEPSILPKWISEQRVDIVLAKGVGQRAQTLFDQNGIKIVPGVAETDPEKAVLEYLNGILKTETNACDH